MLHNNNEKTGEAQASVSDEPSELYPGFIRSELDELGLDASTFRVFCHVLRRAGTQGQCYASAASMATICKLHVKTVRRCLQELVKRGLLDVKPRSFSTSIYTVNTFSKWTTLQPNTVTPTPQPDTQTDTQPATQTNTQPATQTNTQPATQTNTQPDTQTDTQTDTQPATQTDTHKVNPHKVNPVKVLPLKGNPHKRGAVVKKQECLGLEEVLALAIPAVLDNETFRVAWKKWVTYRMENFSTIKNPVQMFCEQLDYLAQTPNEAVEMILQSIRNGWRSIFALKNKPTRQQTRPDDRQIQEKIDIPIIVL